jgi:DNA-binding GntR family transcriptional regulator
MDSVIDPGITLIRSSPVPLYYQVARELERAITDGRLAKGAFIANEIPLATSLHISRLTVRRAIQELVDAGMLVRRRGIGTQVVNDKLPRPPLLGSLYDDLTDAGRTPQTTVLAYERVVADDSVAEQLALPQGSTVIYLERCRFADGRRLAIFRSWLTVEAAGKITAADLAADGLYRLLRASGIWPHSSSRKIAARIAGPVEAALLGLEVGDPILAVDSTMQDKSGTRIEVAEQLHDGRNYEMNLSVVES